MGIQVVTPPEWGEGATVDQARAALAALIAAVKRAPDVAALDRVLVYVDESDARVKAAREEERRLLRDIAAAEARLVSLAEREAHLEKVKAAIKDAEERLAKIKDHIRRIRESAKDD